VYISINYPFYIKVQSNRPIMNVCQYAWCNNLIITTCTTCHLNLWTIWTSFTCKGAIFHWFNCISLSPCLSTTCQTLDVHW